jgi:hypothetical protein
MADTFIPPAKVAENAQQALDVRESKPESERGMTLVGLARANQLSKREPVSLDIIQRMVAYFDRHEVDKQGSTWDEQGKGWQAWMGWGGDEGRTWAVEILKENSMEAKSLDSFNPRQRMIASALVEVTHESGKFDWGIGANGAHYVPASGNPFLKNNIRCEECIFYQPEGRCAIVEGEIESDAVCKFWTIPENEIIQEMAVVEDVAPMDMPMDAPMEDMYMDEMKVTLSTAERDALPDADFAIPSSRNFPINSPVAVSDAVSSWGRYEGDVTFETFKQNLIKIALRKGDDYVAALPRSWQDEMNRKISTIAEYYLRLLDK